MSHVFGRNSRIQPPTVARGEGVYLYDTAGKRYLDGSGGAAVSSLGHSDPEIRSAVHHQLDRVAFAHTGFLTSEPAEELAGLLARLAPGGIDRVYFVSGGSEAVEAAVKLARQYFVETGQPERRNIIARRQSFHGNTLGALAAGGNRWRRRPFSPLLLRTFHISPCFQYRGMLEGELEQQYSMRVADELEAEIRRLGPDTVMAFIAEPVVGATLGAVPPTAGYFQRIREICDRYGVLLIADEVMCGMGRTGSLFAVEQEALKPDIITLAKGLGAGYQPIGAMLCEGHIHDAIARGSGFFQHGHTYMGHPVAAATALAVVNAILKRGLLEEVRRRGAYLKAGLDREFGQHPHVGDIRGRGLFMAIELVQDRQTKLPFDASRGIAGRIKQAALEAGLICYPMAGTVDGRSGDHVLLAPAFIISEGQIDELLSKLGTALDVALGTRK
ncbi:MAG: aspartate aminotransferase family protein [Rhodobacteraceae bacterium]|nr:aspartate aminotransferase family protein [Paracoccaceae bacterium]